MKSLNSSQHDIKLSHKTKTNGIGDGDGVWKWSEGWSCIDPDPLKYR